MVQKRANIRALIIRIGFWGPLCYTLIIRTPPPKKKKKTIVLVIILEGSTGCYIQEILKPRVIQHS